MESRFVNYTSLISFLGALNIESFKKALIESLGQGPKFIPRIGSEVTFMEYNDIKLIKIDLLYYIEKGIFSDNEKSHYVKELKERIHSTISKELKSQKVLFTFETE